jgi:hypothetical protein
MRLLLAALCALLTACSTAPQVTAVIGPYSSEGRRDASVTVLVTHMIGKHVGVGAVHKSELTNGEPFDNDPEQTGNGYGVAVQFGGKPR